MPGNTAKRLVLLAVITAALIGMRYWLSSSTAPSEPAVTSNPNTTTQSVVSPPPTNAIDFAHLPIDDPRILRILPGEHAQVLGDSVRNARTGRLILPETPQNSGVITTNPGYIGARACAECHTQRVERFTQTAHFNSTAIATIETSSGEYTGDASVMSTRDSGVSFEMQERDDGIYQAATIGGGGEIIRHTQRIDLTIGSSKLGQSYLYWHGDRLYQLPVTYLEESHGWVNSPGYADGNADFARPVPALCMECHATYIAYDPDTFNRFDPNSTILGVTCERCHGPGEQHAAFHRGNPNETGNHFITHPGELPRELSIDICAQCHSSRDGATSLQPAFSFRPGNPLSDYVIVPQDKAPGEGGVHTNNQVSRLAASQCFIQSPTMSCATCHNPHRQERGNSALFSQRCMECHTEPQHTTIADRAGPLLQQNCVDCHMPVAKSVTTPIQGADNIIRAPLVRDHLIAVYPELSELILEERGNGDRREGAF